MKKLILPFLLIIIICLLLTIIHLFNIIQGKNTSDLDNIATIDDIEVTNSNLLETIIIEEDDSEDKSEIEAEILANSGISREEAITIALEDANSNRTNLVFLNSYIKKYNGHFSYNVEFKTSDDYIQYDYIINAMTGEIDFSEKH